jgi:hypothetical protein
MPSTDDDAVWYASYGSNLASERFRCYIDGGTPPGGKGKQRGARDRTPPADERGLLIPHQLYFSGSSKRWGGGAVAWIDHQHSDSPSYGRMYRISRGQFVDVVRQENGKPDLPVDEGLDRALTEGYADIRDDSYGRLVCLEEREGAPVLTFTHPKPMAQRRTAMPHESYLRIIAVGLREAFCLNAQGMRRYLVDAPGIDGKLSHGMGKKLFQHALKELGQEGNAAPDPERN